MRRLDKIESKTIAALAHGLTLVVFLCLLTIATWARANTALSPGDAAQVKSDLFAIFDQEDKSLFSSLPHDKQEKALTYYAEGRKEQPNKKKLYKGVVNLMRYYRDIVIMNNVLAQLHKTGKLPDGETPSMGISAQIATNGFPGGARYVDLENASKFDVLVIDLLHQEASDLKKEASEKRKNIELLKTLLKAL